MLPTSFGELTAKDYWDSARRSFQPYKVGSVPLAPVLEKYLPVDPGKECIEIGAYPGRYLCYLATRFQYRVTALDYSDHSSDIDALLRHNSVPHYRVVNENFLKMPIQPSYDVVSSFGFVEHFENYEEVIARHAGLLRPGGILVISVPYLGGAQGLLRRLVFTDEAIRRFWGSHETRIMNLGELRRVVQGLGLTLLFADFVLGTTVWFSWSDATVKPGMRKFVRIVNWLDSKLRRRVPSSRFYSPAMLLIARQGA